MDSARAVWTEAVDQGSRGHPLGSARRGGEQGESRTSAGKRGGVADVRGGVACVRERGSRTSAVRIRGRVVGVHGGSCICQQGLARGAFWTEAVCPGVPSGLEKSRTSAGKRQQRAGQRSSQTRGRATPRRDADRRGRVTNVRERSPREDRGRPREVASISVFQARFSDRGVCPGAPSGRAVIFSS